MKKPNPSRLTLQAENEELREHLKTARKTIRELRRHCGTSVGAHRAEADPRSAAEEVTLRGSLSASEHELGLTRELLESVTEGARAIIAAIDTDYRYTYFNRTHHEELKRLTGKDTTLGMSLTDVLADFPAERDAALALWTRALSGETVSQTIEFGDPGRYRRSYATRHTPIRDARGTIIGAGEVTFDVTQRIAAENALRESEAKYRSLFDAMIEGFSLSEIILDARGRPVDYRLIEVNPAWETITGIPASDVIGKTARERPGTAEPDWMDKLNRVALSDEPCRFEYFFAASGRWVDVNVYSPKKGFFARTLTDITLRKQAETETASIAKFPTENPNPILRVSPDGVLRFANEAAVDIAGCFALAVGRPIPADWWTSLTASIAHSRRGMFEVDCRDRRYSFDVVAIETADYINLYGRDVTDLQRSEAGLRESETRYRTLAENSPDLITRLDKDLRFTYVNARLVSLAGIKAEDFIGRRVQDLNVPAAVLPFLNDIRTRALATHDTQETEFEITLAGDRRAFNIRVIPEHGPNGEIESFLLIGRDITDRKQAEQVIRRDHETLERLIVERTHELLTARMELEMARRLSDIGTLAATVAHELRNPLAAITVAAANIERKAKNPLLWSHLSNIRKKVNESDQIINNLLFFSRIKTPRYQVTELQALIDECLETTGLRARDRITLDKKVDAVRGVAIEVDPVQVQEVLTNLMNNARDALGEQGGNIEIHADLEPERITIKIADNGMGIDERDLERVFEPFFTTKAKGTGLGLAVCRQIVALHGGTISIDSAVGKGTAVVVSLPRKS